VNLAVALCAFAALRRLMALQETDMRTQVMALAVLACWALAGAAVAQPQSPPGGAAVRPEVRQLRERVERRYTVIEVRRG